MAKIDAAQLWSLNYRLLSTVITSVARDIGALGVEPKELFLLAAIDEHTSTPRRSRRPSPCRSRP